MCPYQQYRSQKAGDLAAFLSQLLEQPSRALEAKSIHLDAKLDGPATSGILRMAEEWSVQMLPQGEMEVEGDDEGVSEDAGDDESEAGIGIEGGSDVEMDEASECNEQIEANSDIQHGSTEPLASAPDSTTTMMAVEDPPPAQYENPGMTGELLSSTNAVSNVHAIFATIFEDLVLMKQLSNITESEEPPMWMYVRLLSALLSVCQSVEKWVVPEEWKDAFPTEDNE